MNFKQKIKEINKNIANKYGKDFVKEAKREQKLSYLHKTTKIPSKKWINKKKKEHKCITGADYTGQLRKNRKYDKTKYQIKNKTKYGSIIIRKNFINRVHRNIIKKAL